MLMTLQGKRELDFKDQTGNLVQGTSLFVSFKEDGVEGQATAKIFAKKGFVFPDNIKIGDNIECFFNQRGKLDAIIPARK
ncbi:MAG: hypothetical protein FWC16_03430 [Defluviitaleaceae bacterium]|nr:hypothetical protein [Defluviitaleaceae bacterium]MCL2273954.1 hypothetical protein [Defluviitaleaceae bacterium]